MQNFIKVLWIIVLILALTSGFKVSVNSFEFEWVGVLEQSYNIMKDRIDKNKLN